MKGPIKLSLAILLALSGTDAMALGLGQIHVKSSLNEPLNAEIPVLSVEPDEATDLKIALASAEDFSRVGLSRDRVNQPLEFTLDTNSRGDTIIRVTTKEVVREPFLDFLIQVNWSKGKLLREYTVLLDPPVMAPASKESVATAVPVKEHAPVEAKALPETSPSKKVTSADSSVVVAPKSVSSKTTISAEPKSKPSSVTQHLGNDEYGPVAQGQTLLEIARATRPDASTNLNQMLLALLKNNPQAFYKDNVNALKRGAILRIPSAEEITKIAGSASEAAIAVRDQHQLWTGNTAVSKQAVMVETAAPAAVSATPSKSEKLSVSAKSGEHLALVPPAKDSQASREPTGSPASASKAVTESKVELARTKETLAAREQETEELKSRVKQLEEIKNKNDQLLALKNAEMAELQQKLKEAQEEDNKLTGTAVTTTAPVVATPKPAAANADEKTGKNPTEDMGDKLKPDGAKPASDTHSSSSANPSATDTSSTNTITAVSSSPGDTENQTSSQPVEVVTPTSTGASSTASPTKSAPVAKVPVLPPSTPTETQAWYSTPLVLYGGGGALLLIGLFGLFKFMRRPSSNSSKTKELVPSQSVGAAITIGGENEQTLLNNISRDPENLAHHLALLSYYYVQSEPAKFETAAENMYVYVADHSQLEWQQAKALGEEMAPNSPLFTTEEDLVDSQKSEANIASNYHAPARNTTSQSHAPEPAVEKHAMSQQNVLDAKFEQSRDIGYQQSPVETDFTASAEDFTLDLNTTSFIESASLVADEETLSAEPSPKPQEVGLSLDFDVSAVSSVVALPSVQIAEVEPAAVSTLATKSMDEEFFAGEDVIGTKLDLAKAYMDMGDPDGARSMLDEVLNEGNDEQKGEARKLMMDIR